MEYECSVSTSVSAVSDHKISENSIHCIIIFLHFFVHWVFRINFVFNKNLRGACFNNTKSTTYVCMYGRMYVCFFLLREKCFMHHRYYVPMCRTVLDVPTKTPTSSSLAFHCQQLLRGVGLCCSAFRHFQFPHCSLWGTVVVGLLVFLRSCSSSQSFFITAMAKPLTADHFCSVVNINFTRVSGSGFDPSVSFSSFLSPV